MTRNKRGLNREGRSQTILISDGMILYLTDPKNSNKKLLEIINAFGKVAEYKINTEISSISVHQQRQTEKEIRDTIKYLRINFKKKKPF
jgi:hypothetical protein